MPAPQPQIADGIELWLTPRTVRVLRAHGIATLADLTVRVQRQRRWWSTIPGLGQTSARQIEIFFESHPRLTERARALINTAPPGLVVPRERLWIPHEVDGPQGSFRAPRQACTLDASNDYQAVQAWLSLHEAPSTQRAYRKEAERLILWAIMAWTGTVVSHHGRRDRLSELPAPADTARAPGRASTAAHGARLAAVRWKSVPALDSCH